MQITLGTQYNVGEKPTVIVAIRSRLVRSSAVHLKRLPMTSRSHEKFDAISVSLTSSFARESGWGGGGGTIMVYAHGTAGAVMQRRTPQAAAMTSDAITVNSVDTPTSNAPYPSTKNARLIRTHVVRTPSRPSITLRLKAVLLYP